MIFISFQLIFYTIYLFIKYYFARLKKEKDNRALGEKVPFFFSFNFFSLVKYYFKLLIFVFDNYLRS